MKNDQTLPLKDRLEFPHHLVMEGRSRLSIAGVEDVESFDEEGVICATSKGTLIIKGQGLRIDKLVIEGGELNIEGTIDSLEYEDTVTEKGGFFSRMLR